MPDEHRDVIEVLEHDHREVEQMFGEPESRSDRWRRSWTACETPSPAAAPATDTAAASGLVAW